MTELVAKTLGPNGKNIVIDDYGLFISSDGYKVAKSIRFEDRVKNIGANLLLKTAELTKDKAGDGTTSSIVLSNEFVKNILSIPKINQKELSKEIKHFQNKVSEYIDSLSIEARDVELLYDVAYTSSCSEKIAQIVSNAVMTVGELGAIIPIPTYEEKMSYVHHQGIVYDKGYISSYLTTNETLIMTDAYVILVNDHIKTINELENIIYDVKKTHKDILVIALSFSKEVIDHMIYLYKNYSIKIAGTMAPEYGDKAKDILEDIAIYLDTYIITNKTLYLTMETVGKAKRIEITKNMTIIKKDINSNTNIQNRIEFLKNEYRTKNEEYYLKRLAYLTNGIVYIKIPSFNDYQYEIQKEKVKNAINSCLNAYRYKAVKGGGFTLYRIQEIMSKENETNNEIRECLNKSLSVIYELINKEEILDKEEHLNEENSSNKENKSFKNALDSAYNTKVIINNSLAFLELFMSLDGAIIDKEKPKIDDLLF